MIGLSRLLTQTPPGMPRLDRENVVDAFGAGTIFVAIVTSLPVLMPGGALVHAIACGSIAWGFAEVFTRHRGLAAPACCSRSSLPRWSWSGRRR